MKAISAVRLSDERCELAEWHQVAEEAQWPGRHGQLLHLTFRTWLTFMEEKGDVVQTVAYRRLAARSGRTLGKVHQYMSELVELGWLNQLEPGHYQRWGDDDDDRKAARWGTATLSEHPIGQARIEQRLAEIRWRYIDEQNAVISSWGEDWVDVLREEGFIEPYPGPSFDDRMPPVVIPPGLLAGGTPSGSFSSFTGSAELLKSRSITENMDDTYPRGCYPSDTDGDDDFVGVLAPSPLDYFTWADAWQQSDAGVLGWALARQQVRWAPSASDRARALLNRIPGHRAVTRSPGFSAVTPSEAARLVGIKPQNGARLLQRLADRGFAEKTGSSYRLLFEEAFNEGRLSTRDHQRAAEDVESGRQETQAIRAEGFTARRRLRGEEMDGAASDEREPSEAAFPSGRHPKFRTTSGATRADLEAIRAAARTYPREPESSP